MNLAYEPLFTPFSIRNTRIKNRYFMAAMGTVTHNDEDGAYLPDAVDYFVRRAAGGVGLIITGAPVEQMPFEEVDYWPELCQIMDWSTTHVHSTLHICWGAQAGLYHHYGIQKHDLPAKASGVFEHYLVKPQSPLVRGFDDRFYAVHSRNTDVRREDVEAEPQLEVVAVSDEVGLYIVKSTDSRRFFVFGHPEYDTDTLRLEYERDVKRGLNPEVPAHYFPGDDPSAEPRNVWRSQAQLFYTNWLNYYVYQTTPYDLARAGEEH